MTVFWQPLKQKRRQPDKEPSRVSRLEKIKRLISSLKLNWLDRLARRIGAESEPQVWEKHDRHGHTFFKVYDPQSDRYLYLSSEDEVRVWLEERYSH